MGHRRRSKESERSLGLVGMYIAEFFSVDCFDCYEIDPLAYVTAASKVFQVVRIVEIAHNSVPQLILGESQLLSKLVGDIHVSFPFGNRRGENQSPFVVEFRKSFFGRSYLKF